MTKPILILKEIPGSHTPKHHNVFTGYETIRIWQFNYGGDGAVLVSYNDEEELTTEHINDLNHFMCGDSDSGHRWYRPANLSFNETKPNKMTQPILILKEIPGSSTPKHHNVFEGYETIRIWHFNYDGKGSAIVSYDDEEELNMMAEGDLYMVMCGDPGSGHRWYKPLNLSLDAS